MSVALDLADEVAEKDWSTRRALIFGTGAYAGATIAALRERGCTDIWVNSRSGRAAEFAAKREVSAVPVDGMEQVWLLPMSLLAAPADPTRCFPSRFRAYHTILDLALSRDFDPSVADLPNVELITLESVRLAAPEETEESVATATRIVESELAAFVSRQRSRTIDSAIVALRSHTMDVLDSELEKVRNQFGCGAATEQFELAMRRMVKSLLHTPTVRAKKLASEYAQRITCRRWRPSTAFRWRSLRSLPSPLPGIFHAHFHASGGEYFISPRRSTACSRCRWAYSR